MSTDLKASLMTRESDSDLPAHPAKGPAIPPQLLRDRVAAVRRFNRFYTRRIGVLNEAVFGSAFSLGEMRLLWELGHQDGASASKLQETLGVDPASVSRILRNFREHGWVEAKPAEHDARIRYLNLTAKGRKVLVPFELASSTGVRVGCVFVMEHSPTVAQLRLLLVDPSARGSGLGARLVEECVGFARAAGYRRLFLWTHGNLKAARHLYVKSGFRLVKREKHRTFGHDLMGETYSLSLTARVT
jgi:DNA-binding MarR family transcriptional regulator